MSRFVLNIELGNEAMQGPSDIAAALAKVAAELLEVGNEEGRIRDTSGNTCGRWAVTEGEAPAGVELATFIVHATCEYTVESATTGERQHGTNRPTINVDAADRNEAVERATEIARARVDSAAWPVVAFSLRAELITDLGSA